MDVCDGEKLSLGTQLGAVSSISSFHCSLFACAVHVSSKVWVNVEAEDQATSIKVEG